MTISSNGAAVVLVAVLGMINQFVEYSNDRMNHISIYLMNEDYMHYSVYRPFEMLTCRKLYMQKYRLLRVYRPLKRSK